MTTQTSTSTSTALTHRQLAQAFRRLSANDLPSAQLVGDDVPAVGAAHEVVRMIAQGEEIGVEDYGFAESLYLRADADGWRKGVTIVLAEVR